MKHIGWYVVHTLRWHPNVFVGAYTLRAINRVGRNIKDRIAPIFYGAVNFKAAHDHLHQNK